MPSKTTSIIHVSLSPETMNHPVERMNQLEKRIDQLKKRMDQFEKNVVDQALAKITSHISAARFVSHSLLPPIPRYISRV